MEWVCPLTKEADQQLTVSMRKLPNLGPGAAPMSKKLGHFIARLRPFRRQYVLNHSKGLQSRNLRAKTALLEILGGMQPLQASQNAGHLTIYPTYTISELTEINE